MLLSLLVAEKSGFPMAEHPGEFRAEDVHRAGDTSGDGVDSAGRRRHRSAFRRSLVATGLRSRRLPRPGRLATRWPRCPARRRLTRRGTGSCDGHGVPPTPTCPGVPGHVGWFSEDVVSSEYFQAPVVEQKVSPPGGPLPPGRAKVSRSPGARKTFSPGSHGGGGCGEPRRTHREAIPGPFHRARRPRSDGGLCGEAATPPQKSEH